MKARAETKAVITIYKIHPWRKEVTLRIDMPDGRPTLYRTLKEGEVYHNSVVLEVEAPHNSLTSYDLSH